MREWQDLHAQLESTLEDLGTLRLNESNAHYDAIHRSVLSGLLGHVAHREDRNLYKAAGNRQVFLFPGSGLYYRPAPPVKGRNRDTKQPPPPKPASGQPEWLVAGEMVETSQLFIRTVAGIDPLWITELAPHLCAMTFERPHYSPEAGRVLAEEETRFNGFLIRRRHVAYGNVNPAEATRIFIRSGLVEGPLFPENPRGRDPRASAKPSSRELLESVDLPAQRNAPVRFKFLEHNQRILQKVETWQTRARRHDFIPLDDALERFYAERLTQCSSIQELNKRLGESRVSDFLCATEEELIGSLDISFDASAFPDTVTLEGQQVPLQYAYKPGEEEDGVTVKLGFNLAQCLSGAQLEWAVPGLREAKIGELLRSLPKALRRDLMPLAPKVAEIVRDLQPSSASLKEDLARFLRQRYGVSVTAQSWTETALPDHLRVRVEVVDDQARRLESGRDLAQIRRRLEEKKQAPPPAKGAWQKLAAQWEKPEVTSWSFGDLPERIEGRETDGTPVTAFPGLASEQTHIHVRLFPTAAAARTASREGFARLVEIALGRDLAWVQKDLRALARYESALRGFMSLEQMQNEAFICLRRHILPSDAPWPLTEREFMAACGAARGRMTGLVPDFFRRLEPILKLRAEIASRLPADAAPKAMGPRAFNSLSQLALEPPVATLAAHPIRAELNALAGPDLFRQFTFEHLPNLQRYLRAVQIRAERAAVNPAKDAEKARQLAPYLAALSQLRQSKLGPETARLFEDFRWAVEEYKISLFAQELGTAFPVSPKRLDERLQNVRSAM
jgi:ATP-dependent helicase HrpA